MPSLPQLKSLLNKQVENNTLSHAIIIEGQSAEEKYALAMFLTKRLFCKGDAPPCEICEECKAVEHNAHPDVSIIVGEAKNSDIKIGQIREISKNITSGAIRAKERIYIIKDIENLNTDSTNAFLKTLEEPPSFVRFIMTCSNKSALYDTILSRCVVYSLNNLSQSECEKLLGEEFPSVPKEDISLATLAYDGDYATAKNAFLSEEGIWAPRLAWLTLSCLRKNNRYDLLKEYSKAFTKGDWAKLSQFLDTLYTYFSQLALAGVKGERDCPFLSTKEIFGAEKAIEKAKIALNTNCSVSMVSTWLLLELGKIFGG